MALTIEIRTNKRSSAESCPGALKKILTLTGEGVAMDRSPLRKLLSATDQWRLTANDPRQTLPLNFKQC